MKRDYVEKSPSKFSLRPKTAKDCSFQNHTKYVPGPGSYSVSASENKNGFIMNSRYKSGGAVVISGGAQRFNNPSLKSAMQVPGPGNYEPKVNLNEKGNYSLAKFRNSGAPVFTKAGR